MNNRYIIQIGDILIIDGEEYKAMGATSKLARTEPIERRLKNLTYRLRHQGTGEVIEKSKEEILEGLVTCEECENKIFNGRFCSSKCLLKARRKEKKR